MNPSHPTVLAAIHQRRNRRAGSRGSLGKCQVGTSSLCCECAMFATLSPCRQPFLRHLSILASCMFPAVGFPMRKCVSSPVVVVVAKSRTAAMCVAVPVYITSPGSPGHQDWPISVVTRLPAYLPYASNHIDRCLGNQSLVPHTEDTSLFRLADDVEWSHETGTDEISGRLQCGFAAVSHMHVF